MTSSSFVISTEHSTIKRCWLAYLIVKHYHERKTKCYKLNYLLIKLQRLYSQKLIVYIISSRGDDCLLSVTTQTLKVFYLCIIFITDWSSEKLTCFLLKVFISKRRIYCFYCINQTLNYLATTQHKRENMFKKQKQNIWSLYKILPKMLLN